MQSFAATPGEVLRSSSISSSRETRRSKSSSEGVPGFVRYTALRSGEGGVTVTICQDKTGTDSPLGVPPSGSRRTSALRPTRP
jgi:hypothetical protein